MIANCIFIQDNFRGICSNELIIGDQYTITDGENFFTVGEKPPLNVNELHKMMNQYLDEKKQADNEPEKRITHDEQ